MWPVPSYRSVTSDLLSSLSADVAVHSSGSSGAYSRVRRRISRFGSTLKRGVTRLANSSDANDRCCTTSMCCFALSSSS